jgi:hypothetical protein
MKAKDYFLHGLFSSHSGDKKILQRQLHWTLRITAALCFIGHGTWGLITKSGWLPFFASQGIEPEIALDYATAHWLIRYFYGNSYIAGE